MKTESEIENISKYILEQIENNGYYFILGDNESINEFANSYAIEIIPVTTDLYSKEIAPILLFDYKHKKVTTLRMFKKTEFECESLKSLQNQSVDPEALTKLKNMIGIVLEEDHRFIIVSSENNKDTEEILNKILSFSNMNKKVM